MPYILLGWLLIFQRWLWLVWSHFQ
jgi:hypothetical protein